MSSSRVPALIAEGFEQKTDRHFAHYLYLARGSAKETGTTTRSRGCHPASFGISSRKTASTDDSVERTLAHANRLTTDD